MTYQEYKALENEISAKVSKIEAILKSFPKLPNGLVADKDRTPDYFKAKAEFKIVFGQLQVINKFGAKNFKKEIKAEIAAKRMAKIQKNQQQTI